MKQEDAIKILKENVSILRDVLRRLERSFNICTKIGSKENYRDEEFDNMETLASRFARVSDIVFQKLFRSIDQVELEDKGTLLDCSILEHQLHTHKAMVRSKDIIEL